MTLINKITKTIPAMKIIIARPEKENTELGRFHLQVCI